MSSVWQKEVNNVFAHHESQCTCWRYSKKNKINKQNKAKPTMNVLKENTVSEYFVQRSLTGFPKLCQIKKQQKKQKNAKT